MEQALLSICIPTFNREKYLKRLLDALLPAIARQQGTVTLSVIDNASSDGTGQLCRDYQSAGHALTYIRNEENIGADANAVKAFEQVDGIYGWVLGDDEYVYEQTLDSVVAVLSNRAPAIVYLKSETCTAAAIADNRARGQAFDYHTSRLDYARNIGVYFTFISAIIFRKALLVSADKPPLKIIYGTYIPQLAWVLPLLEQGSLFACSRECLIAAEPNNTGGYRLFEVFGANIKTMLDHFLTDEPKIRKVILTSAMWFLASFFYGSASDFKKENPLTAFDFAFKELFSYRLFVRPLLSYKNLASKIFVKAICHIRKNTLYQS